MSIIAAVLMLAVLLWLSKHSSGRQHPFVSEDARPPTPRERLEEYDDRSRDVRCRDRLAWTGREVAGVVALRRLTRHWRERGYGVTE